MKIFVATSSEGKIIDVCLASSEDSYAAYLYGAGVAYDFVLPLNDLVKQMAIDSKGSRLPVICALSVSTVNATIGGDMNPTIMKVVEDNQAVKVAIDNIRRKLKDQPNEKTD